MQTSPPPLLSLLLTLAVLSGLVDGLCNLENGTVAKCHELGDVKYIETYDLDALKTTVTDKLLDPGLFANLSSLRHLDLSGGSLERVEPGSFRKLANLRSLDLSDNRIEYLELASLDGLNHLHTLNLRRNRFSQLPPALARLKILKHLDVQENPLRCNCATLRVRDLIVKRNVKLSKKTLCMGPTGSSVKGVPLLVPDTTTVCNMEEQDRQMQKDQPDEGSGAGLNDLDEENEEEEYVEVHNTPETPNESEIETPYPETAETSTVSATSGSTVAPSTTSTVAVESRVSSSEEDIYLDNDEKVLSTSRTVQSTEENRKDSLVYPVEGSGDDEEGSGEGSGTGTIFTSWTGEEGKEEDKADNGDSLLDILFSVFFSSTAAPEEKKDPDLEEEQFINISGLNESEEEVIVPQQAHANEAVPSTAVEVTTRVNLFSPTSNEELVETETIQDTSRLKKMKVEEEEGVNDELAEVSPARQSKKGMGSYVVLAALLAVLAALIGFAAYKGDFCKRKRKRGDVENGTELKDMQKALLDGGNAAQPKIASNGTSESVPLVEHPPQEQEETRKSPNGTSDYSDPIKPPRRTVQEELPVVQDTASLKDESPSARTSSIEPSPTNGALVRATEGDGGATVAPPVSPGAQRVKITLQDNPDSVPKTPILITRTLAGENLVKSP